MRSSDCSERSRDLEKQTDPDVRVTFAYVGRSSSRGGRDHGYQRGAHGVAQRDMEKQGENRRHHHAPAESREGPQEAGQQRREEDEKCGKEQGLLEPG